MFKLSPNLLAKVDFPEPPEPIYMIFFIQPPLIKVVNSLFEGKILLSESSGYILDCQFERGMLVLVTVILNGYIRWTMVTVLYMFTKIGCIGTNKGCGGSCFYKTVALNEDKEYLKIKLC